MKVLVSSVLFELFSDLIYFIHPFCVEALPVGRGFILHPVLSACPLLATHLLTT